MLAGLDGQLTEILQDEAAGYFAGSMTAEQAARNIQSRASLYLQEHRRGMTKPRQSRGLGQRLLTS